MVSQPRAPRPGRPASLDLLQARHLDAPDAREGRELAQQLLDVPARRDAHLDLVAGPPVFDHRVGAADGHAAVVDDLDYSRDLSPRVREVDAQDGEGVTEPRDDVDPYPAQQVEGDEHHGG